MVLMMKKKASCNFKLNVWMLKGHACCKFKEYKNKTTIINFCSRGIGVYVDY